VNRGTIRFSDPPAPEVPTERTVQIIKGGFSFRVKKAEGNTSHYNEYHSLGQFQGVKLL